SIAAIAIAASTAFPPRLRTSRPTSEASGWLLATIACRLRTTDRPGLTREVWLLSWARGWIFVINVSAISAVAMQIRVTSRGNEMIVVRDIRRTFRISIIPGWLITDFLTLRKACHQNASARILTNQLVLPRKSRARNI